MKNQVNIITLGVNNIRTMKAWYEEKFGWSSSRNVDGNIFFRNDGLSLVLVDRAKLARDVYVWKDELSFKNFTLTISFNSRKDVDNIFEELRKKKVTIIREPCYISPGIYKGCITDPEDNYWELGFYSLFETDNDTQSFWIPESLFQS